MQCMFCLTDTYSDEPFCSAECEAAYGEEDDHSDTLEPDDDDFNCLICLDGSVVNDICDDCGERHCPSCEVCE